MNQDLYLLLAIENLMLMHRGFEIAGPTAEEPSLELLDQKIERLRHQVPGRLLSIYDRLARQYSDPITVISDGDCHGCHQEVSPRLAARVSRSPQLLQCEHCGRLIIDLQPALDYLN